MHIGELTAREVTINTAGIYYYYNLHTYIRIRTYIHTYLFIYTYTYNIVLKRGNDPLPQIKEHTSQLLESLGLTKVADGIIGTLIFVSYLCRRCVLLYYYTCIIL